MKIAIIGAGGIGSVAAAYLTKAGVDVTLVGREPQRESIAREGLKVIGVRGEETFHIPVLNRLDKEYDLVVFTVKTQDLEDAYQQNNEFLEGCYVLSSQNGVQSDNILGMHVTKEKLLSSIVMFGATYTKPGEVTFNFEGGWIIGRPFMALDDKAHEIVELIGKAFSAVPSNNIMGMKYLKLFVNFNNCIPALIGKSMQETFADMDLCHLSIKLLKEGVSVIQTCSIQLVSLPEFPAERIYGLAQMPVEQAAGIMNQTLTKLSKEPLYGSILQSILRGKPSEIDFINGEIVRLGKKQKIDVSLNDRVVEMVHRVEETGKYFSREEVKKEFGLTAK